MIPLYALAALDVPTSSTKPRGSKIPTRSTFSDIGNDCPYLSHFSPPLRNSSLAVPHTGNIHVHISFSVDYVFFFSWVGFAAVSCLAVIYLGFVKGSSWSKRPFRKQGIYIGMLTTSCDKEFHDEFKIMFSYQMMHSPRAFVSFFLKSRSWPKPRQHDGTCRFGSSPFCLVQTKPNKYGCLLCAHQSGTRRRHPEHSK